MKKYFVLLFALCMALSFTSCDSVESKAEKYAKETLEAVKKSNPISAAKVAQEAEEYRKTLSDEEKAKFDEVMTKWIADHKDEFESAMKDQASKVGSALDMFGGAKDDNSGDEKDDDASSDQSDEDIDKDLERAGKALDMAGSALDMVNDLK